ncbi:MAG: hypothetical protein IKM54_04065 [Butyricicoccus sp.]|nr:hypothetical protein [Butyricicoccus sp.]
MMQLLLGAAFAAFAVFAALACFFQFVTGHHDGSVNRDMENTEASAKRDRAVRRARLCSIAAAICLAAALACGVMLRLG